MIPQNIGRFLSWRRFWNSSAILVVPFARLNVSLVTGFLLPHVVCRAPLSSCAVVHPPAWLSCHRHSATGYQPLPFNAWTFSPQETRWARSSSLSDYGIFLTFIMIHRARKTCVRKLWTAWLLRLHIFKRCTWTCGVSFRQGSRLTWNQQVGWGTWHGKFLQDEINCHFCVTFSEKR